jgi:hypothetical protein
MNPMAEHTVVTKHFPDGRIAEFVKTPISLVDGENLKAEALLRSLKAEALQRAKMAKSPCSAAAGDMGSVPPTSTLDQKITDQPQKNGNPAHVQDFPVSRAPVSRAAPASCQTAVEKTRQRLDAKRRKERALQREVEALLSTITAYAAKLGNGVGRSTISSILDEKHKDYPPGTRAQIKRQPLEQIVGSMLDKMRVMRNFAPAMEVPEFTDGFTRAFWAGADGAVADFNEGRLK